MNKKSTATVNKEVLKTFPGKLKYKVNLNGRRCFYDFTDEQIKWLLENVEKKYSLGTVARALNVQTSTICRQLGLVDAYWHNVYIKSLGNHLGTRLRSNEAKRLGMTLDEYESMLRKNNGKSLRDVLIEKANKSKVVETSTCVNVNAYDDMVIKEQIKRLNEERKRQRELKKQSKIDAVYAVECLKRFPKDCKPLRRVLSIEQENLRAKMKSRGYILPEDDEMYTDNATNVYWNNATRRHPELERQAVAAKLSVIKYSDMFPDMSNRLASLKIKTNKIDLSY